MLISQIYLISQGRYTSKCLISYLFILINLLIMNKLGRRWILYETLNPTGCHLKTVVFSRKLKVNTFSTLMNSFRVKMIIYKRKTNLWTQLWNFIMCCY